MIKRMIAILLVLSLCCCLFVGCDKKAESGTTMLSFAQAENVTEMEKLSGKSVSIIGYMSTLSPVSGKFMYLMNLPYQSCPFCIPNTTQLSNTIAVYAPDGKGFEFTDRAIQVTGTLEFGEYTDEFGYQYGYRIINASYEILDTSEMSQQLQLWQQLASTNVIAEVYNMYEYVNFLCFWPTYTMTFSSGKDYLYPADALMFIETDGYQYNYGYQEGYFDNLVATIEEVNPTAFADLVKNIRDAEALAEKALSELKAENYTVVKEYSTAFKDGRNQYKMNLHDEFDAEMESIYKAFSQWLSSWEL